MELDDNEGAMEDGSKGESYFEDFAADFVER